MRTIDINRTTEKSSYTWDYLWALTFSKHKSGPSNLSTTGGFMPVIFSIYLMNPHLGPPSFSV
jgi:hypothetical protein